MSTAFRVGSRWSRESSQLTSSGSTPECSVSTPEYRQRPGNTTLRSECQEEAHVLAHAATNSRRTFILAHGRLGSVPVSEKSHRCIIDPAWRSKMIWDLVIFVLIAYQVAIVPVELTFVEDNTFAVPFNVWWFFDFIIGVLFLIDLLLNCITAYMSDDGMLVESQWQILRNYLLKPPFFMMIDTAALLPFFLGFLDLRQDSQGTDSSAGYVGKVSKTGRSFRYLRLIRVMRLLRLARAMKFVRELEKAFVFHGRFMLLAASFVKITVSVFCMIHMLACIWRWMSHFEEHALKYSVDVEDIWASYSLAVWVAVMTLVGEPPFEPFSRTEMWINSLFLITSVTVVSLFTAVLVKVFDSFTDDHSDLNKKLRIATRFISRHNIEDKLKSRVLSAVRTSFQHQRSDVAFKTEVEPLISQDLKQRLHGSIHTPVLNCFPPFAETSPQISALCSKLAVEALVEVYEMGSLIFQEGGIESSMFFIVEGLALLRSETYQIEVNVVSDQWFFGERCFFQDSKVKRQLRRLASLFALRSCTVLEIDRNVFLSAATECALDLWLSSKQQDIFWMVDGKAENGLVEMEVTREGYWGCPACKGKGGAEGHWLDECQILIPWLVDSTGRSIPKKLCEVARLAYAKHHKRVTCMVSEHRRTSVMPRQSMVGQDGALVFNPDGTVDNPERMGARSGSHIFAIEEINSKLDALHDKIDALTAAAVPPPTDECPPLVLDWI